MPDSSTLSALPYQGSGLGYRHEIKSQIWDHKEEIDCLEVISDRYIENPQLRSELEELCDEFRVIPHGIGLSVGAPRMNAEYLSEVRDICAIAKATYYSEHLCMTRAPGIDIGHLAPLWFTEEVLASTIDNVNCVQDTLGLPLILENTTYPFEIPGADMSQPDFFHRMVNATGCGILLDITNVRINAENHGFDAIEFLDQMPLEHVVQLHTSGGYLGHDGVFVDGHCDDPDEKVWSLLDAFAQRADVKGAILEHDDSFPEDFERLMKTVNRTRSVLGWELETRPSSGNSGGGLESDFCGREAH